MNRNLIRRRYKTVQCIKGIFYPPRCPGCDHLLEQDEAVYVSTSFGDERIGCCHSCREKLFFTGDSFCMHCGRPLDSEGAEFCCDCERKNLGQSFRQGRSVFSYRGAAMQMMYRFKYAGRQEYALFFSYTAMTLYEDWFSLIHPEVIIPVPMYRRKQRRRGYNQAETFGRELARMLEIRCDGACIRRIRNTRPMKELDDHMRVRNLSGAFETASAVLPYKRVLLVDDIYTTGATADEVTRTLLSAGVKEVYFLSVTIGKGSRPAVFSDEVCKEI